ncbi:hypothetical protein ACLI1A_01635 [Flavobacterium sp. RHBU_3]|uniref:hypothetical protein n=1 Tax=Flavobacterium sp. RHBU_3 TaxID=3391184 RepID=UPI003984AA60
MKNLDNLLLEFKANCNLYSCKSFLQGDTITLIEDILGRLNQNYSNKQLLENIDLLVILYQFNPIDASSETRIFRELSLIFCAFIKQYFSDTQKTATKFELGAIKNLELFIDFFFHNPSFTDTIIDTEKEDFIKALVQVLYIPHDGLILTWEYSVSVFLYFPDEYIEKHKHHYLNHHDYRVRAEFTESY